MNAASLVRTVRMRAGLTLRELASRAGTSHATLSAYESGRTAPAVTTLDRIVRAAGFELRGDVLAVPPGLADREARGRELWQVLELAAQFPARHDPALAAPRFARARR